MAFNIMCSGCSEGGTDGCGAPVSGLQLQRSYFFGWLVLGQENFLWEYCNVWPLLVVNLSSQIRTGTLKKKKAAFPAVHACLN